MSQAAVMETEAESDIEFELSNERIEINLWYKVTGAPIRTHPTYKTRRLAPQIVKFTYVDGDLYEIMINARVVGQDNSLTDKWEKISDIFATNTADWPTWVHEAYELSLTDFATKKKAWL